MRTKINSYRSAQRPLLPTTESSARRVKQSPMATVFIPPLARELTDGADQIDVDGKNVKKLILALDEQYPGIRDRLCDGNELKAGLTIAVDGNVSSLGLYQKVQEDSEVHFVPAIGGG